MKHKAIYIVAGPNGAGKTTFAKMFLPAYAECSNFINADLIAQGLAPFNPPAAAIKAGKLVLNEIHEYSKRGISFGFETTLSGKYYAKLLSKLKSKGYALHLYFLWVPNPEFSIARIKDRVKAGGHHVPPNDVRRRFSRSINNFFSLYETLLDSWMLFDNSSPTPILIAKKQNGHGQIVNKKLFKKIQKMGKK